MNYITTYNIQQVSSLAFKSIVLHPTSIAYIQDVITPYAKVLDTATDIDGIKAWLPLVLSGVVGPRAIDTAVDELAKLKGGLREGPEFLELAKKAVVDVMIRRLISNVEADIIFITGDNEVLPWDIKESIILDENLRKALKITQGYTMLPVEVIINDKSFTHEFTNEFTCGLLLYSLMSRNNFIIRLFGIPFNNNYFLNPQGNRYTKLCLNKRKPDYSILIGGVTYCFVTTDFIQGFATGALWFNDDHHKYWSNLISYVENRHGAPLEF